MRTRSVHQGPLPSTKRRAVALAVAGAAMASVTIGCDVPAEEEVSETRAAVTANVSIVGHLATPGNVALPGIAVKLTGSLQKSTITDSNGNFIFAVPPGSYSVSPLRSGATFNPTVINLNSLIGNAIADFGCSGSCAGGPAVVAAKELVITHPTVVNDARASNAASGRPWSFRFLMEQMTPAGTDPADFANAWLSQFEIPNGSVNGFPVDVRNVSALRGIWPTTANGKLDMSKAPFRLLAIVNRVDLHANSNGEARFVFGAVAPGNFGQLMTVIFEYGLPAADPNTGAGLTRKSWATKFHNLGTIAFGSSYNSALQTVTDLFVRRNTSPSKPGGNSINQVRTNEIVMGGAWQLREFHLTSVSNVVRLRIATTGQTPIDTAVNDGTPENQALVSYINGSAALLHGGYASVPTGILGGQSTESFSWFFSAPVDEAARHAFAGQTCNGCHFSETAGLQLDGFYQISPTSDPGVDGTGRLSEFVKGFEIPRRTTFLQNVLTCSGATCSTGAEAVFL